VDYTYFEIMEGESSRGDFGCGRGRAGSGLEGMEWKMAAELGMGMVMDLEMDSWGRQ
jgi:hypothetical protein